MKPTLRSFSALTLLASLALTSTQSSAASVYIEDGALGSGLTVNLVLPVEAGAQNYYDVAQNITVGQLGKGGSIVNGKSFLAYCIDPFQWSPGSTPASYSVSTLNSQFGGQSTLAGFTGTRADAITKLYSQAYAGTATNDLNTAAFQLALWELADDDGNLATGLVHTTAATTASVVSAANVLLNNVDHAAAGSGQYSFTVYTSPTSQDYLVASSIPEPDTYALMFAGLGAIAAAFRARKNRLQSDIAHEPGISHVA